MDNKLFSIIMFWRKIGRKYEEIKNDPQKSESSTSLGNASLIRSVVGIVLSVGFAVLAYLCFSVQSIGIIISFIGGFLCGFLAILCFVELVLASIVYAYYQLKLNKMPIGKVAMVISLLISVTTIAVVIIALNQFPAMN